MACELVLVCRSTDNPGPSNWNLIRVEGLMAFELQFFLRRNYANMRRLKKNWIGVERLLIAFKLIYLCSSHDKSLPLE